MNEHRILDILHAELRPLAISDARLRDALRRAALRISREALTEQQHAARAASQVGFMVTRGRTKL